MIAQTTMIAQEGDDPAPRDAARRDRPRRSRGGGTTRRDAGGTRRDTVLDAAVPGLDGNAPRPVRLAADLRIDPTVVEISRRAHAARR